MTEKYLNTNTGVLLLAFGGPDSLESVEAFLKSVIPGRPVTAEQVNRAIERYKLIGGKSPLLDITNRQAKALENRLNKNYEGLRVYVGMRHWNPYIKDTLNKMANDGIKRVIAISMAPQNSNASTGAYVKAVEETLSQHPGLEINFVETWHTNPLFIQALADKVKEGLYRFDKDKCDDIHVIFSAHSLPKKRAEKDPYISQLNETIKGVVNLTGICNYSLAYQSKGGGQVEWLEPEVDTVLEELARKNVKNVLLVPVGFVADHVETLYDIDIILKKKAKELGINFKRTDSFNDSSEFINALADVISQELMKQRSLT
jgi:ferrochelatase